MSIGCIKKVYSYTVNVILHGNVINILKMLRKIAKASIFLLLVHFKTFKH